MARPALVLLLLAAAAGCASREPGEGPEPAPLDELTVRVVNHNFYQVTVYTVQAGARTRRLGQVSGNSVGVFTFPWHSTQLQLEIDLLAVGSFRTRSIAVTPGDEVEVVVRADLHRR